VSPDYLAGSDGQWRRRHGYLLARMDWKRRARSHQPVTLCMASDSSGFLIRSYPGPGAHQAGRPWSRRLSRRSRDGAEFQSRRRDMIYYCLLSD
jgi:hypothetical protein